MAVIYGTTPTDKVRTEAVAAVMDILRPLDFLDRAVVVDAVINNEHFCVDCGKDKPDQTICDCKEDE